MLTLLIEEALKIFQGVQKQVKGNKVPLQKIHLYPGHRRDHCAHRYQLDHVQRLPYRITGDNS